MVDQNQKAAITFQDGDKTYDVNKFSPEGKVAVVRVSRLDAEIKALLEQVDDKRAAAMTYQTTISSQLTDDMLVEEEAAEEPIESDSHEI